VALLAAFALVSGCANSLSHDALVKASQPVAATAGATTIDAAAAAGGPAAVPLGDTTPAAGASAAKGQAVPVSPSSTGSTVAPPATGTAAAATQVGKVAKAASPGKKAAPASTSTNAAPASVPVCTGAKAPIVIGAVGQLTGVLGTAFVGGTRAIQAWLTKVNGTGGLGCHPVKYVTADDGGDPARNLALVRQLVEQDKVIAMLYNTGLLTGQASRDYLVSKNLPVIGQEGGELFWGTAPNFFNHGTSGRPLIDFTLIAGARAALAVGKKKLGTLACQEVSYCNTADKSWADLGKQIGLEPVYRGQSSLLTVDFTAQCLAAKKAGVEVLALAFESTGIHRIAQSCASVGFKPMIVCTSVQSNLDFVDDENLDGVVIAQPYLPWFLNDRPAIQAFQSVLSQFAPGLPLDSASINGWAAAQLFSRADKAFAADVVTSKGILDALGTVKNDDLGGLSYPLTFTPGKPQDTKRCGWIMKVQNKKFTSDGKRFCG
jgi:branched-chain amino acid transport system substrate-binding protein